MSKETLLDPANHPGEKVALLEKAKELGVDLPEDIVMSPDKATEANAALTDMEESKATSEEFFLNMQEVREGVRAGLQSLAKKSGSEKTEKFLEDYDKKVDKALEKLLGAAEKGMKKSGKYSGNFKELYEGAEKITDVGLEMLGYHKDDQSPEKEKMRKLMLLMLAMMMAMIMSNFGISPEMVGLAATMATYMENNKDKNPQQIAEGFKKKLEDKEFREALTHDLAKTLEKSHPKLKAMGITDNVEEFNKIVENSLEAKNLMKKAGKFLASLPDKNKAKEEIANEIFGGFESVIKESMKDNEKMRDKLLKILDSTKEASAGKLANSFGGLVEETAKQRKIGKKAEAIVKGISSAHDVVDNFKKFVKESGEFTASEKVMVDKLANDMREYVHTKYTKPVSDFVKSAEKIGAGKVAERLGLPRDILSSLSSKLDNVKSSGISASM